MKKTETIQIDFEGRLIDARRGESLAAALTHAGIQSFRKTRTNAERGIFCGMGVCQDCLVEIDGSPNQRSCMIKIEKPISVRMERPYKQPGRLKKTYSPATLDDIKIETPQVLVMGAGPGGLSAAIAARTAGAEVVVIDERPIAGGQFFKQISVVGAEVAGGDAQHDEGMLLIKKAIDLGVQIELESILWGGFEGNEFIVAGPKGSICYRPQRIIVATGAYERGHIVPGWTLPGVMTTGAAQTLWRSSRRLPGQRVIIAGNGPLNLQLAAELVEGGAEVVALAEAARPHRLAAIADAAKMLRFSPKLTLNGLGYLWRVKKSGVPILNGTVLRNIKSYGKSLRVEFGPADTSRTGGVKEFEADVVCLGYGFEPSNEILRTMACTHDYDPVRQELATRVDENGLTSVDTIYALGDCTGLGGARAALSAGEIAGFSAAKSVGHQLDSVMEESMQLARQNLVRHRKFQRSLWRVFSYPRINLDLADRETIFCRCEEVTAGEVLDVIDDGCLSIADIKRRTRLGMGPCQGRYCSPVLQHVIANKSGKPIENHSGFAPRVPLKPIAITDLLKNNSK